LEARSPYPGLRPFGREEADVFFGRESHVDAIVDRLAQRRLVVVTGGSGSGKSSLVRAGLLEALEAGILAAAGPVWRFAIFRPGDHPMTELATALAMALGTAQCSDNVALRRAKLERGPLSLVEEMRESPLPDSGYLLILADQFEELFRYQGLAAREEAEAFVALLLTSAHQREVPIYVVLTMRSEFLGRCAEFNGLAEAITDAQYLCPRLSREQSLNAITGPASVFGGEVEPRLATQIVNDMGNDPDQLPLMQHVLMRLWDRAQVRDGKAPVLRFDDYVAEGGLRGSLSRHAHEILAEITDNNPERTETTRQLFCLLVDGEGENAVRRPTRVAEVMALTGKDVEEIALIADPFRASGRSLLTPALDRPLTPDTVLDLSHESLIRQWQPLKNWVRTEAASVERYREIERRARHYRNGEGGVLEGIDLEASLAWRERERPSRAWANRYGGNFGLAMNFLSESRVRRDAVEALRGEQQAGEIVRALRESERTFSLRAAEGWLSRNREYHSDEYSLGLRGVLRRAERAERRARHLRAYVYSLSVSCILCFAVAIVFIFKYLNSRSF
jgi:hypothetical protein